jgi:CubicO group peptidase (beta-lactamase class C family)
MHQSPSLLRFLAVALAAVLGATGASGQTRPDHRAERVENGLTTLTVIAAEPPVGHRLADRMRFYNTPGVSVAVIRDGRIDWARGYGLAEAHGSQAVDTTTLFQAASISKPVAAIGALRLVEEGRLTLDGDVNEVLQRWKVPESAHTAREKVTLRRLLSHSAGLTVHGFRGYSEGEPIPTLSEVLDGAGPANSAAVRVDTEPGSRWRYSGGGTSVAQLMMEEVSGLSFPEFMTSYVLAPAGMVRSTYGQPLPTERAAEAASGHRGDGSLVAGRWHAYPEMAAAGLWTTPSDLARLALHVQRSWGGEEGGILTPGMTQTMLTPQSGEYGLGFGIAEVDGRVFFSHGGANEGFRAFFVAAADGRDGAVVMTNSDDGQPLAMEILRSIAREYAWPIYQPIERAAVLVDDSTLAELAGAYAFEFRGEQHRIRLSMEQGDLFASIPTWRAERRLYAASAETFFILEGGNEFTFLRDEAGKVTGVRVTGLGLPITARRVEEY